MRQPAQGATETRFTIDPATRLGPVHLTVADLDRQVAFYQQVLGLRSHRREADTVALGVGGADLLRLSERRDAPRPRGTTGLYHFAILLPTRRELARAVARLYSLRYRHYPTDHVMTKTTYLSDPEGNGIELYADTPEEGSWGVVDGEFVVRDSGGTLRSGREPLDVEALLKELSPGERLDLPMPEATTIGHVHLHVAAIPEALRFYDDLLGFDVQLSSAEMGAAFVSAGGYHHHIGLNTWAGEGAPPPPSDGLGLRSFTVVLPTRTELERVLARVRAAVPVEDTPEGVLLRDPSRNGIVLTTAEPTLS
ncbi:MAG TPA: VOC family protein [bacterium]|jgi:catechol 2,3-dioxygenase|nr:VOC family protein [bacterium]